jgi:hypothetical protein
MNYFTIYGAALLLALLIASPALDRFHIKPFGDWKPKPWRSVLWDLWASDLGAVTVNYFIRGGGYVINNSATGPTQAQAQQVMKQSAVCVFGTVDDVLALFSHQWGVDISAAAWFEPEILVEPISTGTTSWPMLTFWRHTSNVLYVMKRAGDKETTVQITLRRPHSAGQ